MFLGASLDGHILSNFDLIADLPELLQKCREIFRLCGQDRVDLPADGVPDAALIREGGPLSRSS